VAASRPAFHYALLASIALHALLLFAFPDWMETARRVVESPPPIIARLLAPEPAPAPPALPAPPAPPVQAQPKSAPKPALERKAPASAAPTPPASLPAPVPAPPPVASVPPSAATAPAPAPAAPKAEDTTPQTADQYRLQLIDAARRIKDGTRYPPQAWENHWEGDVVLGIALRRDGGHSVVVNRGSRYEVLDQQAVQILSQALREVPIPAPLRGKDLSLREVTVQYRQRD
jgi:TonB family protein